MANSNEEFNLAEEIKRLERAIENATVILDRDYSQNINLLKNYLKLIYLKHSTKGLSAFDYVINYDVDEEGAFSEINRYYDFVKALDTCYKIVRDAHRYEASKDDPELKTLMKSVDVLNDMVKSHQFKKSFGQNCVLTQKALKFAYYELFSLMQIKNRSNLDKATDIQKAILLFMFNAPLDSPITLNIVEQKIEINIPCDNNIISYYNAFNFIINVFSTLKNNYSFIIGKNHYGDFVFRFEDKKISIYDVYAKFVRSKDGKILLFLFHNELVNLQNKMLTSSDPVIKKQLNIEFEKLLDFGIGSFARNIVIKGYKVLDTSKMDKDCVPLLELYQQSERLILQEYKRFQLRLFNIHGLQFEGQNPYNEETTKINDRNYFYSETYHLLKMDIKKSTDLVEHLRGAKINFFEVQFPKDRLLGSSNKSLLENVKNIVEDFKNFMLKSMGSSAVQVGAYKVAKNISLYLFVYDTSLDGQNKIISSMAEYFREKPFKFCKVTNILENNSFPLKNLKPYYGPNSVTNLTRQTDPYCSSFEACVLIKDEIEASKQKVLNRLSEDFELYGNIVEYIHRPEEYDEEVEVYCDSAAYMRLAIKIDEYQTVIKINGYKVPLEQAIASDAMHFNHNPNYQALLTHYRGHLEVKVSGPVHVYMQVLASLCNLPNALAVIAYSNMYEAKTFYSNIKKFKSLDHYIRYLIQFKEQLVNGSYCIYSKGLESLLGIEVELIECPTKLDVLQDSLYTVCKKIIVDTSVVRKGPISDDKGHNFVGVPAKALLSQNPKYERKALKLSLS